jgi:hypothetical protein
MKKEKQVIWLVALLRILVGLGLVLMLFMVIFEFLVFRPKPGLELPHLVLSLARFGFVVWLWVNGITGLRELKDFV